MHQEDTAAPGESAARQDAIDINDFVHAATGARVRRLTMPDGSYWFPAADVCRSLGYAHTGSALRGIADDTNCDTLESVLHKHTLDVPPGRQWRRDMKVVNLQGLVRLANGCTKAEAEPFKNWVTEVVVAVQRDGLYALGHAEVQPPTGATVAYAMPQQVADAIVRLEERNLRLEERHRRLDEEYAAARRAERALWGDLSRAVHRIADTVEQLTARLPPTGQTVPRQPGPPRPDAGTVLAAWHNRLPLVGDLKAVAHCLVPEMLAHGRVTRAVPHLAARTALTEHRVHDCLRLLLRHGCIAQADTTPEGTPVYVLRHP
ncbi:Bro-N domain-containing protein [Streptomyces sp. 549]|uniref:BRO-N domain-containing protein n=1 Tax=Streptomyces sp. 549 TaxID=3049076 RepID=UPI0024C2910C|nr:Bro-N domain-containing protein [Streptomyces sp. 549]MDK1473265.1 Bro-N domain-containing protein [Streptomyces sp. 549]